jgi:tRNA dimethylallyltransferase
MPLTGEMLLMQPLLVVIGPTAAGKTDLAIEIAEKFDGEIISADSRQIYRGMDIGTAKATTEQQSKVPHHLIDIVDPDEAYTVVDFQTQATVLIHDIHARGRLPLLVGGTGQYISATIEGWQFPGVPPNDDLRSQLETYAEQYGWEGLLEKLRVVDPISAERIDGRNIRRVIRAIEVSVEADRPFSEFQRKNPPPFTIETIGLTFEDRAMLYGRADRRISKMMEAGLVDEVRSLMEAGYTWDLPAMSGLGYLQMGYYLQGKMNSDEAVQELKRATRTFIRRQYTWFRKHNPQTHWFESNMDATNLVVDLIEAWTAHLLERTHD